MKGEQEVTFPTQHTNMHSFLLILNTSTSKLLDIVYYLLGTRNKGYYINYNNSEGLKVHVDTDFGGN